ncbi:MULTISPECIES: ACT domain-containing protein [Eubacterium]|jgi:aspartokinase|uniref:aspartate kinase n=2 Tax=Eubacterium TaxID=1730 RepID=A0A1H3Y684_9FIRM|nr:MULTISPECIES: ACT domain-containing protein [Eubacterium]MDD4691939.1 ACT domain-containing protein [Eubacterium aggregans]MEA5073003.1 ACT domain-containing protein [Eubacterium aggregans]SDY00059.1 aspartate kinase [Eubacterium barkeri]SEA06601.1 aspartate kinase [Eubacterium aggregans]
MNTIMESHSVDGLSIDCENLMISLKRVPFNNFIMTRLLKELAEADVNVDVISRTAPVNNAFDVSLIVLEKELHKVRDIANTLGEEYPEIQISINQDITRLSLHGIGMRTQSGVAAKFLQVFADNDVRVLMITTSEISIACVVKNEDARKAANAVRTVFEL